jgi:hypothetical protein
MSVALTVANVLNDAVADFKKAFAVNPALITRGQFQISDATADAVLERVKDEFLKVGSVDPELLAAVKNFKDDPKKFTKADTANAVLRTIKQKKLETTFPETVKVFSPDPGATWVGANSLFNTIWGGNTVPPPLTISEPTAQKLRVAFKREEGACHDVTVRMARKLLTARGSTLTSIPSNFAAGQMANAQLQNEKEGRQKVVYNRGQLDAAVGKIQAAISRGFLYLIGVLSGFNHTNVGMVFPNPEHWLLLFAHDGADTFVFWDSDAARSNIAQLGWGKGFGLLFHKFGRFSTAMDDADFNELRDDADHVVSPRRHRYQAYLAKPIP